MILLHEHQHVVDVDINLLQQLNLKDKVIVDDCGVLLLLAPLLIQVRIHAAIVLLVARAQRVVCRKVIKGREDVAQAQNHAKQTDESLLGLLAQKSVAIENRIQSELLAQLS